MRVYAHSAGRHVHLIAESDTNDASLLAPPERGGMGLDAHWNDDLHHALHALLTGERAGYYESFGDLEHLARALEEGYVYGGRWSPYRRRRHGSPSRGIPAHRLLVYSQTHDQVGNRPSGERLSALVPFEALKLAAATVILSPYLPMLFMGEEYGETATRPARTSRLGHGVLPSRGDLSNHMHTMALRFSGMLLHTSPHTSQGDLPG